METVVKNFYESFKLLDAEGMVEHYHDEIIFEDAAFGKLSGDRAKNMWRMLCASQKGKNFSVECTKIDKTNEGVSAHWEARYLFGNSCRKVHNFIRADFIFEGDKIIRHTDNFNLHRWARQAMGTSGALFGWTSHFQKKLQQRTNYLLDKFEKQP